ncbi:MAG: class I SAM-dependent methyltransferase [Patescibacteria group bacterium]|nr:class I SAM-dependent methyltransferase [Patescibacteria group bacterium]
MNRRDVLRQLATAEEGDFSAWDTMAVELEVAEFLYGLVRAAKPRLVVEAGSGRGYASVFIAEALLENGVGHLFTYEHDPGFAVEAMQRLLGLPATVECAWSTSHDCQNDRLPDFVFLDSLGGPEGRDRDLDFWLGDLAGSGFLVVVHDANGLPGLPEHGVRLDAGRGVWIGHA